VTTYDDWASLYPPKLPDPITHPEGSIGSWDFKDGVIPKPPHYTGGIPVYSGIVRVDLERHAQTLARLVWKPTSVHWTDSSKGEPEDKSCDFEDLSPVGGVQEYITTVVIPSLDLPGPEDLAGQTGFHHAEFYGQPFILLVEAVVQYHDVFGWKERECTSTS